MAKAQSKVPATGPAEQQGIPPKNDPPPIQSATEESVIPDVDLTVYQMRARIARKILILYEKVDYVQKTNRNQQQGYSFASEADFAEKVNEACREAKLAIIPSYVASMSHETVDNGKGGTRLLHLADVKGSFQIIDAETGWAESFTMPGHGQDFSDKAVYKAISGAQKYAYYKLCLCATGMDPENASIETSGAQQGKPAQQSKPTSTAQGKSATTTTAGTGAATAPVQTSGKQQLPAQPAQLVGGEGGSKPSGEAGKPMTAAQGSAPATQTPAAPKEAQGGGAPDGPPSPLKGQEPGIITGVTPPKGPQKAGMVIFKADSGPEPVQIWFWAERLPDGLTLSDLQGFCASKVPVVVSFTPDVTARWRTLTGMYRTDMPDLGSPEYSQEAADKFTQNN